MRRPWTHAFSPETAGQEADVSEARKKISRRDFFRIAGISAGATVAASAFAPPPLRQTSGKMADPAGRPAQPWWVRTVDAPTVEFDWNKIERYDEQMGTVRGPGFAKYVGQDEVDRLNKVAADMQKQRLLDNVPGYTLKDQALYDSHGVRVGRSFLGPQKAATPEERGVPKWTGTPEEAARLLRIALRHYGAATTGFVELDDNTRKLVYSNDPDGKPLVFEDIDEAYETDEKRAIPLKAKWMVVYTVRMSEETLKRAPTPVGAQTTSLAYNRSEQIQVQLQEFLRGLGYQGLGESSTNALGIAPAFAVLAGLGELSRLNRLITPEFGPMVRVFTLITDLPVATDKPIDAGIMEFCAHCKKCAEACPSGALSFDDLPTWEVRGGWNNPGHKAYFEDSVKCLTYWREEAGTNCGICFAVCPFAKKDKSWVHTWVKGGVATLPVLDSFFRSMDDAFGYGAQKDPELWWHLDLPELGIDTHTTVKET
jgi:epoxyqueuosine reductase